MTQPRKRYNSAINVGHQLFIENTFSIISSAFKNCSYYFLRLTAVFIFRPATVERPPDAEKGLVPTTPAENAGAWLNGKFPVGPSCCGAPVEGDPNLNTSFDELMGLKLKPVPVPLFPNWKLLLEVVDEVEPNEGGWLGNCPPNSDGGLLVDCELKADGGQPAKNGNVGAADEPKAAGGWLVFCPNTGA